MGFTFCNAWDKKADVIAAIKGDMPNMVDSSVVNNTVFGLHEHDGARFISITLLAKQRGQGWGYKSMHECEHPYYYNCPLRLLNLASPTTGQGLIWRAKVRQYHATRAAKAATVKKLAPGVRVKLVTGCTVMGDPVTEGTILSVNPLLLLIGAGHMPTRFRKSLIAGIIEGDTPQ